MPRCPRCRGDEVIQDRITLPSRDDAGELRVAYEYFCQSCKLAEGAVRGEADFEALEERWRDVDDGGGMR